MENKDIELLSEHFDIRIVNNKPLLYYFYNFDHRHNYVYEQRVTMGKVEDLYELRDNLQKIIDQIEKGNSECL